MCKWKELTERVKNWRLEDAARLLAEARIAAHAYDLGARSQVGIGTELSLHEIAEAVLDDGKKRGVLHDEVEIGEFGNPIDGVPIYKCVVPIAEVPKCCRTGAPTSLRETPLMFLYTADEDNRQDFWSTLLTSLLFDCGIGTLQHCEVAALKALATARRDLINGRI